MLLQHLTNMPFMTLLPAYLDCSKSVLIHKSLTKNIYINTNMEVAISEDTASVVKDSINREIVLLESKINLLESEIKKFEEKYQLTSPEFEVKFDSGNLDDSQDFFEWWGLIRGLKTLEDNLIKAKSVVTYW